MRQHEAAAVVEHHLTGADVAAALTAAIGQSVHIDTDEGTFSATVMEALPNVRLRTSGAVRADGSITVRWEAGRFKFHFDSWLLTVANGVLGVESPATITKTDRRRLPRTVAPDLATNGLRLRDGRAAVKLLDISAAGASFVLDPPIPALGDRFPIEVIIDGHGKADVDFEVHRVQPLEGGRVTVGGRFLLAHDRTDEIAVQPDDLADLLGSLDFDMDDALGSASND